MQISSLMSSLFKVPSESKWLAFSIQIIQTFFNHAVIMECLDPLTNEYVFQTKQKKTFA